LGPKNLIRRFGATFTCRREKGSLEPALAAGGFRIAAILANAGVNRA
jgi:hypothetical protein